MDLQSRFDELENIVDTLRMLCDEIEDKDYKEDLQIIMYSAQDEMEEVNNELEEQYRLEQEEWEREMQEMNRQFEASRL